MTDLEDFNMDAINDIVYSMEKVIKAANPNLKGRLINVLDIDNDPTFKIMKKVRDVVYYYNPDTKKKTRCLTVQEVMRIPSGETDIMMREFAKRFLVTAFMWTTSQIYTDLINGKFESEPPTDKSGEPESCWAAKRGTGTVL